MTPEHQVFASSIKKGKIFIAHCVCSVWGGKVKSARHSQSHYREVPRWEIFVEQELRFGLDLGRMANFPALIASKSFHLMWNDIFWRTFWCIKKYMIIQFSFKNNYRLETFSIFSCSKGDTSPQDFSIMTLGIVF